MNGINRVVLLGYVGANPELQTSKEGKPYTHFSLATHFNKKTVEGEKESSTTWHNIKVFGKTAERCGTLLSKGALVAVEGYISKYKSEKEDGKPSVYTDIVAQQVHFLSRRQEGVEQSSSFNEIPF